VDGSKYLKPRLQRVDGPTTRGLVLSQFNSHFIPESPYAALALAHFSVDQYTNIHSRRLLTHLSSSTTSERTTRHDESSFSKKTHPPDSPYPGLQPFPHTSPKAHHRLRPICNESGWCSVSRLFESKHLATVWRSTVSPLMNPRRTKAELTH